MIRSLFFVVVVFQLANAILRFQSMFDELSLGKKKYQEFLEYECRGCQGKCQFVSIANTHWSLGSQTNTYQRGLNPFECLEKVRKKCAAGKEHFFSMTCRRADSNPRHFIYADQKGKLTKNLRWREDLAAEKKKRQDKVRELDELKEQLARMKRCENVKGEKEKTKGSCASTGGTCMDVWRCNGEGDVVVPEKCSGGWENKCCYKDIC